MENECAYDGEDDVEGGEDSKGVAPVDWHGLALGYVDDQVGSDEEAAGSLPDVRIRELKNPLLLAAVSGCDLGNQIKAAHPVGFDESPLGEF